MIDHLVYVTPDLARGVAEVEHVLGVTPSAGGQHPGRGTRNALVALGSDVYLEIIGPDPEQPDPDQPRMFGVDAARDSQLATWAATCGDLERLREAAVQAGIPLGDIKSGSRRTPDGGQLSWRFTDPSAVIADGLVPFFIDWGSSPHPAAGAARGATLVSLRAEHPDPSGVARMIGQLGLTLPVTGGARPALIAVIDGPRGPVELR